MSSSVLSKGLLLLVLLAILVASGTSTAEEYPLRDAVECTVRGGLPNVFAKLAAGDDVRIAYLGGSITAQQGWRPKTLAWFQKQYPDAKVSQIDAAIGGTGSGLGVFRLNHDALRHKPDLLFVEFAVNDGGTAPASIHRSMEGILRQALRSNPAMDICYVYTLTEGMLGDLQGGKFPRAASAMEALADHYGIPSIHMGLEVALMEQRGAVVFKGDKPKTDEERAALGDKILFSTDGVHPLVDSGHKLYLQAVVLAMGQIQSAGEAGPHAMPEPFVKDNWEGAKMVSLDRATLSPEWERLDPAKGGLAKRFGTRLPGMWKANAPGATITFRFKGTQAAIYDLLGPDCGQVTVTVDDAAPVTRPRFDAYCTYHRLATLSVASGLPDAVHTVTLEIHPEQPDKPAILSKRNQTIDDPARYDDTAWYAGSILLLGDLVE